MSKIIEKVKKILIEFVLSLNITIAEKNKLLDLCNLYNKLCINDLPSCKNGRCPVILKHIAKSRNDITKRQNNIKTVKKSVDKKS